MASAKEGVAAAAEKLRQLMVNPDRAGIEALVAEDVDYGHSNGRVHAREALIEDLSNGNTVFRTMDVTDQTIKTGDNVAIVRHVMRAKTFNRGVDGEVHLSILQAWHLRNGTWKMIARQAVKL